MALHCQAYSGLLGLAQAVPHSCKRRLNSKVNVAKKETSCEWHNKLSVKTRNISFHSCWDCLWCWWDPWRLIKQSAMSGEVTVKWTSKEMVFKFDEIETVGSLKRKIEEETRVQPKRQKLIGLKAKGGKLATDDVMLTDLALKPGQKIMLMGYVENSAPLALTERRKFAKVHRVVNQKS
jgi:hypothetical protein